MNKIVNVTSEERNDKISDRFILNIPNPVTGMFKALLIRFVNANFVAGSKR